jgi:hypothetical protein
MLKMVNMHTKYKLHEVYTSYNGSAVDWNMLLCYNKATNEVYTLYACLPFLKNVYLTFDDVSVVHWNT